jgi:hypothetical protein
MLKTFAANGPLGLFGTNAARDSYCSAHSGDAAPAAYPMGTPSPYGNKIN